MNTESNLQKAQDILNHRAQSTSTPEANRMDAIVGKDQLLDIVHELHTSRWGYLMGITGLDQSPEPGKTEVLYHFARGAAVLTLRVQLERDHASVPSICAIIPPASLYEREVMEMFGITMENTPNSDRLFLAEDWPKDVFPLRKDFIVPTPPPAIEVKG
jgi:Ni,Fe-hydrogenase III component G